MTMANGDVTENNTYIFLLVVVALTVYIVGSLCGLSDFSCYILLDHGDK